MYVNSKKKNKLVFLFFTVADYLSASQILLFSANLLYRSYERSDWGGARRPFTRTEEQKVSFIRYRTCVSARHPCHLEETVESF